AVTAGRSERLTIGADGKLGDAGCVSCKGAQGLPRLHVPEFDAVITFNQIVGAAGNKRLAIWTEHECGDAARVAGERAQELARVCVPELDGLVPTCRRKLLPVGTEHERRDDTRVPARRLYELALTQIPQFDRLLLVNERQHLAVRRQRSALRIHGRRSRVDRLVVAEAQGLTQTDPAAQVHAD